MKTLLITVSILLLEIAAQAADSTNLIFKVTAERVISGVTNSANTSFNVVPSGSQKDAARINGLAWAFASAQAGGFTNTLDNWVAKTWVKDNADVTANAYLQSISQDTLSKLSLLVLGGGLSPADLSTVTTIANKAPVP